MKMTPHSFPIGLLAVLLTLLFSGSGWALEPQPLFSFQAGVHPEAGLTLGPDGNFYGTTRDGGINDVGSIFSLTPDGVLTSVFSFSNTDGAAPLGALLLGSDGNFYGTTSLGGASRAGTVFRFSTNGVLTTLSEFNGTNGANPQCQLVMDASGNLYGTAPEQGPDSAGTVFRVTTNGVLTTLVAFNGDNGASPEDGLTVGSDGNFYGTTANGGDKDVGTVFKVTPGGDLTTIFSFGDNGANPLGGLVQGGDGNFYGTTGFGGSNGFGTIFKITTNGVLTTLFNFDFTDGQEPSTKLIFGPDGSLYGTTAFGGSTGNNPDGTGLGTVFRITPDGVFTPLIFFQGDDGSIPEEPLALGADGNLYGATAQGGFGGGGTIFRIVLTPHLDSITQAPAGDVLVTGTGPSAAAYRVWASSDLLLPVASWTQLTNGVIAKDGTFSFTDAGTAAVSERFYRVSTP